MRRPPGVSDSDFSAALQKFANVVGAPWVFTSDEDLDLYRDAYSVLRGEPGEYVASAAVAPDAVEQVQAIVRIANQHKIPLYPFSTGRNLGYGGSAPAYSGSVILDLKRMNRVIEVNEALHYALVEPGCSFFDLYRHLREKGIRQYPSVPAPGWGSPIGNSLDHGCGNPARDHFRNHCGMEVVLPTGELLRTGMGAMPGAKTWQTYHYGFGPWIDGLFSQSNFGVVTKMGFNLFPEPESAKSLTMMSFNYDDLDAIVGLTESLEASGVAPHGAGCFSPLLSARDPEVMGLIRGGGGSAADWNRLSRERKTPVFTAPFNFSGAPRVVDAQMETVNDKFSALKGVAFAERKAYAAPLNPDEIDEPDKNTFGIPTLWRFFPDLAQTKEPIWSGHVWFSPNIPQTGEALRTANRVFQKGCDEHGLYWGWSGGISFFPKNFTLLYAFEAGADAETNRRSREGFLRMVAIAAENGWSEYRSAPAFMDAIMEVFSFNGHALRRFNETLKDAIDPNGILSAGRYGIWPKHLRKARA